MVGALKFRRLLPVAEVMAERMHWLVPEHLLGGAVVSVPAAPARRRRRGFDPAGELAAALASRLGTEPVACLARRGSGHQVGRRRAERIGHPPQIEPIAESPRSVLLIDDVLTTGATLTACAAALRERRREASRRADLHPAGVGGRFRSGVRDGRAPRRGGRPSCVPGVSWRPGQAVAATRRPGREGVRGKVRGSARSPFFRHGSTSGLGAAALDRRLCTPEPAGEPGDESVTSHDSSSGTRVRGGLLRSPALATKCQPLPHTRPSRPRPQPARAVAETAASLSASRQLRRPILGPAHTRLLSRPQKTRVGSAAAGDSQFAPSGAPPRPRRGG